MKKRFYTVLTLALMAVVPVSAQGLMRSKAHARSQAALNAQARQAKAADQSKAGDENLPRMIAADQLPVVMNANAAEATVQKTVPAGYSHSTDADVDLDAKILYDKNGNVIEIEYNNGTSEKFSYTYNEQNKWTEKISTKVGGGAEKKVSEEDRTYDEQGRLLTADEWGYDSDTQKKYPVRSRAYTYNEKGGFLFPADDGAYELKYFTYKKVGDKYLPQGYEFVWFEPTESYLLNVYSSENQYEAKIEGNTYVQEKRDIDPETGNVTIVEYRKCEVQANQPQGYDTCVYSHSEDGTHWTYDEKDVKSLGYDEDFAENDGKHREKTEYEYDEDTQKFEISSKTSYDWVNHPTLHLIKKVEYKYEDGELEEVNSYLYPVKGGVIDHSDNNTYYLAEDNSYVVYSYSNSDEYDYYTYYQANGEEYRKLRIGDSKTPGLVADCVEEYKDGQWILVKNETLQIGSGDNGLTAELNEKGYPVWSKAYVDGVLDLRYEAEYSDGGYSGKGYTWSSEKKQEVLEYTSVGKVLADGSQEVVDTEYNNDGSIYYVEKTVYQTDGIEYYYRWNTETSTWYSQGARVPNVVTTAADGTITTISRQWQDGKVVETEKTMEYKNADGSTNRTEYYTKDGEAWVPEHRVVYTAYSIPDEGFTFPTNPLPGIIPDDVFSFVSLPAGKSGVLENTQYWDKDANQWTDSDPKLNNSYSEREENGQKIITVVSAGTTFEYTFDSHNRLTAYEGNNELSVRAFVYNAEGRLSQVTYNVNGDVVETYQILYGAIDVTDGIGKPAVSVSHLHIDGKTVTAAGSKSLRLYGVDGKLVGESQQGIVTAPSAGIYVVVADGVKTKVVLR